ncbi:MAG: cytochrome c maturation protein CcmE [bacterium]|nr:MAG: cytochrome c maturation protein CcmE [bacterium]
MKILVAVLAVVAGVGYLIFTGISDTGVYYRTVSEVLNGANIFDGRAIRISGEVVEDTVAYDQEKLLLTFSVRDTDNRRVTMQARYEGVMPDAFKEGAEVILEGTYSQVSNLFSATTLLAKCPSKYVAEADAETGSGK